MHKNISICIIVSIFLLISCPVTITSNNTTNTNQNSSDNNNTNDNGSNTGDGGGGSSGGSNTQNPPSDPIIIDSAEDLQLLAKYPTGNFEITTNIDMTGKTFTPIPTFGGTINGKKHTISNLTYEASGAERAVGGFITATSGNVSITQLIFDKIDIKTKFTNHSVNAYPFGGLFGKVNHNLTLQEVGVIGDINGSINTGGIIGSVNKVSVRIEDCYFILNIESKQRDGAFSLPSIGGIIGNAKHGITIKDTLVLGSISNGDTSTNNLFPSKEVLIQWSVAQTGQPPNDKLYFENIYSAMEDKEKARFLNPDPASADSTHTGVDKVGEIKNLGLDAAAVVFNGGHKYDNVAKQASYKNWDFVNTWKMSTGTSPLPVFKWQ